FLHHHLSGLLRRLAPTAGQGPLAGEAPWPLCALCVSAVNPYRVATEYDLGIALIRKSQVTQATQAMQTAHPIAITLF
ncbi:MAG TPA: hypothetical protein DDY14_02770, partial [Chromatiaceae bacterium]|nr:hypothetical protein [Chromatiaceae bacterium]